MAIMLTPRIACAILPVGWLEATWGHKIPLPTQGARRQKVLQHLLREMWLYSITAKAK